MNKRTAEQTQALARLAELLPAGTPVSVIVRHVARSGMSRSISPVITTSDGTVHDLTYLVARAGLFRADETHGGLKLGGVGMDMGFHLVYSIARAVFPDGHPCTGHDRTERRRNGRTVRRCPSNEHSNGDRVYRRGRRHQDGGYGLTYQGSI